MWLWIHKTQEPGLNGLDMWLIHRTQDQELQECKCIKVRSPGPAIVALTWKTDEKTKNDLQMEKQPHVWKLCTCASAFGSAVRSV
ncbi:unnamed protein product [Gadus morhua 'NCC']